MASLETLTFLDTVGTMGKVLQFEHRGVPLLVLGVKQQDHSAMTVRLCDQHGIPLTKKMIEGHAQWYPEESSGLTLIGAGIFGEFNKEQRTMICGGVSLGYQIRIDETHLQKIKEVLPDWTITHTRNFYG